MPAWYAAIMAGLARITASAFSVRLTDTACQLSNPLNSEKESPPGTFKVYLSCFSAESASNDITAAITVKLVTATRIFMDVCIADSLLGGCGEKWIAAVA